MKWHGEPVPADPYAMDRVSRALLLALLTMLCGVILSGLWGLP